jgi:hypothetical protein
MKVEAEVATPAAGQQVDARLVGVWVLDEGYQVTELLFRADGRYQVDTKSTNPELDYLLTEQGTYHTEGQRLTLTPYEYFGAPQSKDRDFQLDGELLSLIMLDYDQTQVYTLKAGSRQDVLDREAVDSTLIGTWVRNLPYSGQEEYTFRPGGYYFVKTIHDDGQFPPEYIRGRYVQDGERLSLRPYSGVEAQFELDFFGTTLTLIRREEFSGGSLTYEERPGSEAEVLSKSAEAEAFLAHPDWLVGTWEVRDAIHVVDLTIRPDGYYIAKEDTEYLSGIVRGRYVLEPRRITLLPYVGQGLYARSNGEFGKVERMRELDYYDGELQFIDLEALSQSVTLARKRPGSDSAVTDTVRAAQAEREREGWHVGVWEVNDPAGWMEFTFRPDNRYIAKGGADRVPAEVERGEYAMRPELVMLAPYAGQGPARGFELDLYDGDLFLIGDLNRLVVARKLAGSEQEVIEKTFNPESMKGERGSVLGLWTANLPGEGAALVFRPDGEYRLQRCINNVASEDYGLYTADMATRTLLSDSRFVEVQNFGLDFYGSTMTIFGGSLGPPRTFTVNLGQADAAIEASFVADAEAARVDAQWMERVPVGARDPNAVQVPTADIPADPNPGRVFDGATVLSGFHLYRRFIPGFAYFNVQGTIRTVPVMNSREFYMFPTGRVLVRFRNHRATFTYPITMEDVSDSWGAYRVEPKPEQRDVLHRYADNGVFVETDLGEQVEMTLEDGRRHLFWGKDFQVLSEWVAEQRPIACQGPVAVDPSLMNTGISLATTIVVDPPEDGAGPVVPENPGR